MMTTKTAIYQNFKGLIFLVLGIAGGATWHQSNLNKSNVEVMSIDSDISQDITAETKIQKVQLHEKRKINASAGTVNAAGLLLLESARANAIKRTDQNIIIKAITSR